MPSCRVCGSHLGEPIYHADAPGITSMMTSLDIPTRVYACASCGHVQSEGLPDVQKFYDTEYRISLDSNEHDQLYAMVDGKPVFRTDRQAELVLQLVDLPSNARILDYGAAKAVTLKKIMERRPDLRGHVFDVSRDYASHWESWLPADRCATYALPDSWKDGFDLVTTHFVLEHVDAPVDMLRSIRAMLKPRGVLFLSVPDIVGNPGDLLVVDHLNHFCSASLERALLEAGYCDVRFHADAFSGGLVATAKAGGAGSGVARCSPSYQSLLDLAAFWSRAGTILDCAAETHADTGGAIYGAGFYGTFIAARIARRANLGCFVDRNPHLQGKTHFGLPVLQPGDLPTDVGVVFAGLNPLKARSILENVREWKGRAIKTVFLVEETDAT